MVGTGREVETTPNLSRSAAEMISAAEPRMAARLGDVAARERLPSVPKVSLPASAGRSLMATSRGSLAGTVRLGSRAGEVK